MEGNGLSVCLPLRELRIELLNKTRTHINGHSKATFIQSVDLELVPSKPGGSSDLPARL